MEEFGAKMAVKSANIGRQDNHFGINLAASGSIWEACWNHLDKQIEYRKTLENNRFLKIWEILATRFGATWRCVELCWAILAPFRVILGVCWDMLVARCTKIATKSTKWSQTCATGSQTGSARGGGG